MGKGVIDMVKGVNVYRGMDGTAVLSVTVEGQYLSTIARMAEKANADVQDGKEYEVILQKVKKSRSLDANAFAWTLIDKISAEKKIPKSEVYRNAIREIGGVSTTVCVPNKAAETLCRAWGHKGMGWQTDTTQSKLEGCTNVTMYYGSSAYDTEQMSRLIDSLVQDAEALGIDTRTPEERANMLSLWGEE